MPVVSSGAHSASVVVGVAMDRVKSAAAGSSTCSKETPSVPRQPRSSLRTLSMTAAAAAASTLVPPSTRST